MECNKEEAVRAKNLAEKKMHDKDFVGARKLILKAQQLFPELENTSQMLTVCDVHCSAGIKVNGETDWYGILQVEAIADELSIKKQYRKLALLLHPDKNKFSGAEAAFKLIGEAHMTLTDQAKRSLYDIKRRGTIRAAQQPKRNAPTTNNFNPVNLNGRNQQQQEASGSLTFWTICPSCGMRFQYFRSILKKALRCQNCLKPFIAFDINEQAVPSGGSSVFTWNSSRMPQKFPAQQKKSPTVAGKQHADGSVSKESESCKVEVEGDKVKFEKVKLAQMSKREKEVKPSSVNSAKSASKATQKRGRKLVIDSSDSESADSEEDPIIEEVPHAGNTSNRYPRRSSRQKQNVTYNEAESTDDDHDDNEDDDDDEFLNPPYSKRQRKNGPKGVGGPSCSADEGNQTFADTGAKEINTRASEADVSNTMTGNQKGVDTSKDEVLSGSREANKGNLHEENHEKPCSTSDPEASSMYEDLRDGASFSYPDPEFFDFEINRVQSKFAADQIWAIYDDHDGMPRFYARIKQVLAPQFKLHFTWLEYDPDKEAEMAWSTKDLPVACGNFRAGKSEMSVDINMFSHIVTWGKGKKRNTYEIYPRKGEVWATFKGWDLAWCSGADSHRLYEYEVVEVLSDFTRGTGIIVIPLVKIKGFVSLFMQSEEMSPYMIPSSEILRFSHAVPFYRMTGQERVEVPEGAFELDPASLPPNSEEAFLSVTLDNDPMTTQKSNGDDNGSHANFKGKSDQACTSQFVFAKDQHHVVNESNSSPSESGPSKNDYPDSEFYKFSQAKLIENFECSQIWALYSDLDELPKYYALIKRVEVEHNRIHVKWLEACPQREEEQQWLGAELPFGCGVFRVSGEVVKHKSTEAFSHCLQARQIKTNQYEILPCAGEIWAIYKNWRVGWNLSDLENCEYDVVEISECTALAIEVACLMKVKGYAAVFMKDKKASSPMVIRKNEFLRFSHNIPAFCLTNERGGLLQGCWELDPASLPPPLLYMNSQ